MHEIPVAGSTRRVSPGVAGLLVVLFVLAGAGAWLQYFLRNQPSGTFAAASHSHRPGPTSLRLEPAPPVAATLAAMRGHPVLFFNCGPEVAFDDALPQLNLHQRGYMVKGLEVIGVYRGPRTQALETLFSDAGVEWRVFHEAPGAPLAEWKAHLKVTTFPSAVLVDASGVRSYGGGMWGLAEALEKLLGAPAAFTPVVIPEIRGRLLHDGRPASVFTSDHAQFGPFLDDSKGRMVPGDFPVKYDNRTGEFRILNVPEGTYGVYITCGPFWHNFHRFSASGRVPRVAEFALTRRIYLREPVDTSKDVAAAEDCRHRSPVTFRWDAVPGAVEYIPEVHRRRVGLEQAKRDLVRRDPVKEPRLELPIEEGWEYELGVTARSASFTLAFLRIYQGRGLGSSYRFREGQPRVEKEEGDGR